MEPRYFYRGEADLAMSGEFGVTASMEPRYFYRGEQPSGPEAREFLALQWSRDISTAVSWHWLPRKKKWQTASMEPRYFYRGEVGRDDQVHRDDAGFNGAAIFLPR